MVDVHAWISKICGTRYVGVDLNEFFAYVGPLPNRILETIYENGLG